MKKIVFLVLMLTFIIVSINSASSMQGVIQRNNQNFLPFEQNWQESDILPTRSLDETRSGEVVIEYKFAG